MTHTPRACPPARSPAFAGLALALPLTLGLTGMLASGPAQAQAQAQAAAAPVPANEADLARKLDQLAAELAAVKAQLAALQQARPQPAPAGAVAAAPAAAPAPAPAPATAPAAVPALATAMATAPAAPSEPATVLTSYGEINYNRPRKASENTQVDMRRFVLGYQHRFDEQTKVVTELEVEHAVSSADDPGEVEVEQAYIEHQLHPAWAVRGGLFLMPVGLLNENHDPTAFYGVERNFVETAIIPSTWREGGFQVVGSFDNGLTLQTGVSTGFDLNKWDAASTEGGESPLGSVHQELALARGRDLALFGALNWRGIPGLQLGGSLFTGGASQGQPGVPKARVTLWDVHARWQPGRWDMAALWTQGSISNTAAWNTPWVGGTTLIPSRFDGGYVQAAYQLWQQGSYALAPFARWETYNTGRRYAELPAGLTPAGRPTERVATVGANFQLTPGIVLKADVQRFRVRSEADRFDLGLGWSF